MKEGYKLTTDRYRGDIGKLTYIIVLLYGTRYYIYLPVALVVFVVQTISYIVCDSMSKRLLLLFLRFSALVASPKKTTLNGGQSRSWSAEQGKKKEKSLAAPPPTPPRALLVRRK